MLLKMIWILMLLDRELLLSLMYAPLRCDWSEHFDSLRDFEMLHHRITDCDSDVRLLL